MALAILHPGRPEPGAAFTDDERRVVGACAAAVDLRWLGLVLFLPLVDLRGGAGGAVAALLVSAGYGVAAAVAALPLARLSARLGRRAVLAGTGAVFTAGAALLLVPGRPGLAAAGRVVMGLGAGSGAALGWITDAVDVERRRRAHALFALSAALAPAVGLIAGAALGLAPRAIAPAAAVLVGMLALAPLARLPERRRPCAGAAAERADALFGAARALRTPSLAGPLVATACAFAGLALTAGLLPGVLAPLAPAAVLVLLATGAAGAAAGLFGAAALADRGRAPVALALGLIAVWLSGTLLSSRALDHGGAPAARLAGALVLAGGGSALCGSASIAAILQRSPEMWRGTVLLLHQVAAFAGAGAGAALGVAMVRTVGSGLDPVPLALFAITGAAGALLPRAEPAIARIEGAASMTVPRDTFPLPPGEGQGEGGRT